jgi:hypothetical protein
MAAPERVWMAQNGGLPTGNYPQEMKVEYIRADPAVILAAAMQLPEVKALVEERDELAFMGRTLQSWTPHDVLVDHEGAFLAISETADRLAALKPDAKAAP